MNYEIVLDFSEKINKCTIVPLSKRKDFKIFVVKGEARFNLNTNYLLLHQDGICVTKVKERPNIQGISAIDCVWSRVPKLMGKIDAPVPALISVPDGFITAFPRKSKKGLDPSGGLATIEAIFTAAALLGNWDESLFSMYHFGPKYISLNRARFLELGVKS